jgi:predicted O-methyltransferase YrrM
MQMQTLDHIAAGFNLSLDMAEYKHIKMPIELPNFGRDNLGTLFTGLGFTKGAEIGTEQGVFAETLCKTMPGVTLFCIDAWKAYRGYRDHTRQEKLDRFYEITKQRLAPYNVTLIRKFSMDAVKEFKDESLDFVYIDGNHDFINVTQDVYYWSKKVRSGGIVAGHDYIKRRDEAAGVHVKQAMHGYTDAYRIRPWFVLGRDAVVEGEIRDSSRSWMFVKQ